MHALRRPNDQRVQTGQEADGSIATIDVPCFWSNDRMDQVDQLLCLREFTRSSARRRTAFVKRIRNSDFCRRRLRSHPRLPQLQSFLFAKLLALHLGEFPLQSLVHFEEAIAEDSQCRDAL